MLGCQEDYEQVYSAKPWAYGPSPDTHLIEELRLISPGPAVDLGGGQGQHALALAEMGFEVELVDRCSLGLQQARDAGAKRGVEFQAVEEEVTAYRPGRQKVCVAALLFQALTSNQATATAKAVGDCLEDNGIFYLSLPGFNEKTVALAAQVFSAAGCSKKWLVNHVVTRQERPYLPCARRFETRALGLRRD